MSNDDAGADASPLLSTDLCSAELLARGMVRDVYRLGTDLLLVATDRISAFDVIMAQGIPGKGRVLTRVASTWFDLLTDVCPHHLLSTDVDAWPELDAAEREQLRGRTMRCRAARPLPVEWVVRGHLTGSGWQDYQRCGAVSGVALPTGLQHASRLDPPILTPSTKADHGDHDEPISFERAAGLVGEEIANQARDAALSLFEAGRRHAAARGIVIADTKFEFGLAEDGQLLLIDEILTPDSSRFWPGDEVAPGAKPRSLDKQVLRDWLLSSDWDRRPPPPPLPDEVVTRTAMTYREIESILCA